VFVSEKQRKKSKVEVFVFTALALCFKTSRELLIVKIPAIRAFLILFSGTNSNTEYPDISGKSQMYGSPTEAESTVSLASSLARCGKELYMFGFWQVRSFDDSAMESSAVTLASSSVAPASMLMVFLEDTFLRCWVVR